MQSQEHTSARSLPSRDVTEETIDLAFAKFILYSNPYYPCDTDTSELKECLHNVPKSDGKNFTIYGLWQLVQKLETKELKTWIQLALDLGVEPPTAENKASVQKVQQYTVRLKRWMRALHVDAFFEFLLGKKHSYYLDIPPSDDPYPSQGRDGVLAEEDLALRALDPSFKPKRGRKRHSSPVIEHGNAKRTPVISSVHDPRVGSKMQSQTAHPNDSHTISSAHPDHHEREIWTAVTPRIPRAFHGTAPHSAILPGPQNFQWHTEQTPSTPFPMSAIEGSNSTLDGTVSSMSPSSTRSKRKHGPAVSSAWSGGRTIGGKVRGRPSAQRSTTDGAFSSFPAASNLESPDHLVTTTPTVEGTQVAAEHGVQGSSAADQRARLRLQVPQYAGGAVRLMTPPTFDHTGGNESDQRRSTTADPAESAAIANLSKPSSAPRSRPHPTPYEALKRALSADLLRAEVQDRTTRLTGPEAKALALSILTSLNLTPSSPPHDLSTAQTYLNLRDAHTLTTQGMTTSSSIKKIRITRLTVDEDGYTVPIPVDANESAETETGTVRHVYDIAWTNTLGALNIEYSIRDLDLARATLDETVQETDGEAFRRMEKEGTAAIEGVRGGLAAIGGGEDWKAQFELMAFRFRMMRGRFEVAREKVLETVLSL